MSSRIQLTTKDYAILEVMLERRTARPDPLTAMLRRKLNAAEIVFRDDIRPRTVTLNSRVVFRVGDDAAETRVLIHGENAFFEDKTLSISTPRGLALLGLQEGQSARVDLGDGRFEELTVERVAHQPEDSERTAAAGGTVAYFHRRAPAAPRPGFGRPPEDDDPGPAAA
jgi:regulator of nucleoside diphosphate kinase